MLNKWLHRIWKGKPRMSIGEMKPKGWGRPPGVRPGIFRPHLEALEDRTLLSTWHGPSLWVNGNLYFTANDGIHGQELWKSDGTGEGTSMVADIEQGSGGSYPLNFTDVNGTLFFTAQDGIHGRQLWKTDGTPAGTVMVSDLGVYMGDGMDLVNLNGTLFFHGLAGSAYELWKSDGTPGGTAMVARVPESSPPVAICAGFSPFDTGNLTNVNGTLYFFTEELLGCPVGGWQVADELWKSDGTSAGTAMIATIDTRWPNWGGGSLADMVDVNGTLFFSTPGENGYELWKSDGTSAGTVMIESFAGIPNHLFNANGTLFFSMGSQLWKSDGTLAGTVMVADTNPGLSPAGIGDFTLREGWLYFTTAAGGVAQLWRSDGTAASTAPLATLPFQGPPPLTNVNGVFYFGGPDGTGGGNIWESDGTSSGTFLLSDPDNRIGPSLEVMGNQRNPGLFNFTNGGGTFFFETNDNYPDPNDLHDWESGAGTEVWKSDGTAAGTIMVVDVSSIGKIVFHNTPAPAHVVAGATSGNSTVVFSVNDSHQLMRHDGINGWVWMRDNVQSISVVTETSGNVVAFAMTTDNALLRYDTVNGWQSLADPGTIRMISAGTDTSGLADVFVVLTNGSMSEWQQPSGWLPSPLTEPDPVWQGNPVPGPDSVVSLSAVDQGKAIVAFANGSVMQYDSSMGYDGFFGLPMDLGQYAAAVTDATGLLNVFAYSPNGGLWEWQGGIPIPTSSQIATDFSIQELSAGTDANGQANLFAVTAAGALMEYQKTSGWTTLNPPGTVQDLSAGPMDQLFVILTDGRVFERDDQHGFFQI